MPSTKQEANTAQQPEFQGNYRVICEEGSVLAGIILLRFISGKSCAQDSINVLVDLEKSALYAVATPPPLADFQYSFGPHVTRREIERSIAYTIKHMCMGVDIFWADGAAAFIVPAGSKLSCSGSGKTQTDTTAK